MIEILYMLCVLCFKPLSSSYDFNEINPFSEFNVDSTDDMIYIASDSYMIEEFAGSGQLHILAHNASTRNAYEINIHQYISYGYAVGTQYGNLSGFITWFKEKKQWKAQINNCVQDFSIAPIATVNDEYRWVWLIGKDYAYLKCNDKVVATLINDECPYVSWGGKIGDYTDFGGWELLYMKGYHVKFENIHRLNPCAKSNAELKTDAILGSIQLTTGLDCLYTCWYMYTGKSADCMRVWINLRENVCYLVSGKGGKPKDISRYARNNRMWTTDVVVDMDCFLHLDEPCWLQNVRAVDSTVFGVIVTNQFDTRTDNCLMSNEICGYSSTCTADKCVFMTTESGYCRCGSTEDMAVNSARWIYRKGIIGAEYLCYYEQAKTTIDLSYEIGVALEGTIYAVRDYFRFYGCKELCSESNTTCSGWTSLNHIMKCYLYTGPVFRVPYKNGISGTYQGLKALTIVPAPSFVMRPVASNLNLFRGSVTSTPLNFYLNMDLIRRKENRKIGAYQVTTDANDTITETLLFDLEFYLQADVGAFDVRMPECPNNFEFITEPSLGRYWSIYYEWFEDDLRLQIKQLVGETYTTLVSESGLIANCGLNINTTTVWNGIKFKDFQPGDMYNIGTFADTGTYYEERDDTTITFNTDTATLETAPTTVKMTTDQLTSKPISPTS